MKELYYEKPITGVGEMPNCSRCRWRGVFGEICNGQGDKKLKEAYNTESCKKLYDRLW